MINKIYVVGYGMIDSLGNNPKDCFDRMLDNNDYSKDIPELIADNSKVYRGAIFDPNTCIIPKEFDNKMLRSLTNAQKMMLHAVNDALIMSKLPHHYDVATLLSTVSNDTEFLDELYLPTKSNKRVNPRKSANRIPDMGCSHITSHYKFMGLSAATFASCSTGLVTIDYGMRLCDEYEYVIVGGADAGCFPMAIKYFNTLGAVANTSMPFDDSRAGFLMGDGCGVLILQSEKMVKKYGSTVHATLYPCGMASDALDMTSPANDGRGARISMSKAMGHVNDIDFVCAHATSTPIGDPIEYETVVSFVGEKPIWAPKSKIGHTLAAAGILECIYSILSMKEGIVPHIQNLKQASCDTKGILVRENLKTNKKVLRTLNNSFGFGGKCMSQVIEVNK
ncbi:hypothetical protein EBU71_00210 [bacterium]|nr:hypothetical protein [Candidatus Elulimicrobium humile]